MAGPGPETAYDKATIEVLLGVLRALRNLCGFEICGFSLLCTSGAALRYSYNSRRSRAGTTPTGRREGQRHHMRKGTTESSADEDRPLEMSMMRPKGAEKGRVEKDGGKGGKENGRARPSLRERRRKSLVSLASEDDLLGRRMMGFTSGLLSKENEGIPPTP